MEIKILIKTPKGAATKTERKLRAFLVGKDNKYLKNTYINEDDNELVWEMEGPVRRMMKMNKTVARFDTLMKGVLKSKAFNLMVKKEQREELKDMLLNHTTVDVVTKEDSELLDDTGESWWGRVKKKWNKS